MRIQRRVAFLGVTILAATVVIVSIYSLYTDTGHIRHLASTWQRAGSRGKHHKTKPDRGKSPTEGSGMAFSMHPNVFHSGADSNRHMGNDVWRPEGFVPSYPLGALHRTPAVHPLQVGSPGEYIQQKLVADFAEGSDRLFLMMKTGATTFWSRMPVHTYTTLTRIPHFAIYSDHADSIAGYEVIDILANTTQKYMESHDFKLYRMQQTLRQLHNQIDFGTLKLDGGWDLDKYKNIPMLQHAWNTDSTKDWYVFIDDDTYVFFDTLIQWLKSLDHTKPLYMGSPTMVANVLFAHGGSGVILSHGAMKALFEDAKLGEGFNNLQEEYEEHTSTVCCGDYMVGKALLDKVGLKLSVTSPDSHPYVGRKIQGEPLTTLKFFKDNWCQPITTFHHLSNRDVELLWQYERSKGPELRKHITYQDLYQDFLKPYLTDEIREGWTIEREDTDSDGEESSLSQEKADWKKKHTQEGEDEVDENKLPEFVPLADSPRQSLKKCQQWCQSKDWCYQFVYRGEDGEETASCKIKKYLSLGYPKLDKKRSRVGWNVKTVRSHLRANTQCDKLHEKSEDGAIDGQHEEGWWEQRYQADREAQQLKLNAESPKIETV